MQTKESQNRIRALRKERGLTQAELGAKMDSDVTDSTIAKLESGRMALTTTYLQEIARALGVDPMDILGLRGPGSGVRHVPKITRGQARDWRLHVARVEEVLVIPAHIEGVNLFAVEEAVLTIPQGNFGGGNIVVDPDSRELVDGKLYLVAEGDEVPCLRRFITKPSLALVALTPDCAPLKLGEVPFEIIGRVVYAGFEL